jgi:HK97 family phage prohead protease
MEINKSYWHSDGNRINLSVPFFKVDEERRIVSGFATLDNVDRQKDVVDTDASIKAFETFRGNLREMHQPIAVGKVTNFKEEQFFDKETGQTYRGVFVDTYVSKGAQDTWEKVLDGTLSGFSIGGNITKVDQVQKGDDMIRVIKEYELVELSLVDSPANQLANIFAVQKSDGIDTITGIAVDIKMDSIFWCEKDQIAVAKDSESSQCLLCEKEMSNIGWVESNDVAKNEEIGKAIDRFMKKNSLSGSSPEEMPETTEIAKQADIETNIEGGAVSMENENVESVNAEEVEIEKSLEAVEETVEKAETIEEDSEITVEEDVEVEKSAAISEVEVEEPDFVKMLDDLKTFFGDNLTKSAEETRETVEELSKTVDSRIAELAEKHDSITKAVENIKSAVDTIEKRVNMVESETAVKKSRDSEGSKEEKTIRKGLWSGTFLGVRDL